MHKLIPMRPVYKILRIKKEQKGKADDRLPYFLDDIECYSVPLELF